MLLAHVGLSLVLWPSETGAAGIYFLEVLTKLGQNVLLLLPTGKQDFGVQAPHAGTLPRWSLLAGLIPGLHLHLQAHLEQIRVFLLDVTGVQVVPARMGTQQDNAPHPLLPTWPWSSSVV